MEKDFITLVELGNLLFQNQDYNGAVQVFERALGLDPNPTDTEVWNLLSGARLKLNDPKGAVVALERSLALDPTDTGIWTLLGCARLKLNDPKGAVVALERSLALDPNKAREWFLLGIGYLQLGREPEALFCYEQSAALGKSLGNTQAQRLRLIGVNPREVKIPRAS